MFFGIIDYEFKKNVIVISNLKIEIENTFQLHRENLRKLETKGIK